MSGLVLRLLLASGAGALLSLDRRAAAQVMLAHPIVAATIVGALLGDVMTGVAVGVLLGLLWSGAIPVGGVVPPDETLGAVAGAATAVLGARAVGASLPEASLVGFAVGMPCAYLGRRVEFLLRRMNGEWALSVEKAVLAGDLRSVDRAIGLAMSSAFAAAFVTIAIVLAAAVPASRLLLTRYPSAGPFLAAATLPIPIAGLAGVVPGAGFRIGTAWAALGFAVGLMIAKVALR